MNGPLALGHAMERRLTNFTVRIGEEVRHDTLGRGIVLSVGPKGRAEILLVQDYGVYDVEVEQLHHGRMVWTDTD